VAESVQLESFDDSQVHLYFVTGPGSYQASHGKKKGANLKAKAKGGTAPAEAKGNPKRKASGGPTGRVPKNCCSKNFCQQCKAHGGPFTMHNTFDCRCYDSNGKPLKAAAGKPSESKKPYKKSGGDKNMAFMQSYSRLMQKARRKPVSLRNVRNVTMTPVTVLIVNRKLGAATQSQV
jgi:hypothetical protein